MRVILPLLFLVMAWAAPALAQVRESAPLVLELPANTRALGLGNAYVLSNAGNDAIFYQPALVDSARGIGAAAGFYGRSTSYYMSGATAWWGGGFAVGVQSLSYTAGGRRPGTFARGEAGLGDRGDFDVWEHVVSGAYARALLGVRVGVTAKLIEQRVRGERDVTAAVDLGVVRRIRSVTLGFAAQNIGRQPVIADEDVDLPLVFTLGAARQSAAVGPLDVTLAASVSHWQDARYGASAGVEIGYWPISGRTFIARIGFRHIDDSAVSPLTLGAGFLGDRIGIDYAWQDFDDSEPVHRVGLRFR
ncbi:MAG: hypothetical protein HY701_08110 [Gemmatimonadetes bacterium]|nr:hypothetical protein [Gemmatimonadota bacterium]